MIAACEGPVFVVCLILNDSARPALFKPLRIRSFDVFVFWVGMGDSVNMFVPVDDVKLNFCA